jgi:hypothetical protein
VRCETYLAVGSFEFLPVLPELALNLVPDLLALQRRAVGLCVWEGDTKERRTNATMKKKKRKRKRKSCKLTNHATPATELTEKKSRERKRKREEEKVAGQRTRARRSLWSSRRSFV